MQSSFDPAPDGDSGSHPFVDQSRRTRVLRGLLVMFVAADVADSLGVIALPWVLTDSSGMSLAEWTLVGVALARAFAFVAVAVVLLRFLVQANRNAVRISGAALPYSPASMAWWFFVPIASLRNPYLAAKEVWLRSHAGSDPAAQPEGLQMWWAGWLVSGPLTWMCMRAEEPIGAALLAIASTIAMFFASRGAIRFTRGLSARQNQARQR